MKVALFLSSSLSSILPSCLWGECLEIPLGWVHYWLASTHIILFANIPGLVVVCLKSLNDLVPICF